MPLPQDRNYTSKDYWSLPEGQRAELINGRLYSMAPPSRIHQKLITGLLSVIQNHITAHHDCCEVYPSPFAVNLDSDDRNWVEPDISVICDPRKLTDRGCSGAPDWVIEIVSPSSRKLDYTVKTALYSEAGVREYWIVDPGRERVMVYYFEEDPTPVLSALFQPIQTGIFPDLTVTITDLLH